MSKPNITRNQFMAFFRSDECINTLSADDRVEIFRTILTGSSDFIKELLDSVLIDYCVEGIEITDHKTRLP